MLHDSSSLRVRHTRPRGAHHEIQKKTELRCGRTPTNPPPPPHSPSKCCLAGGVESFTVTHLTSSRLQRFEPPVAYNGTRTNPPVIRPMILFQYSILFWRESEVPRPGFHSRRQSACPKPHLLSLPSLPLTEPNRMHTYEPYNIYLPSCSTRLRSPAFPHHANMQSIFITKCPSEHNGPSTTRYNHLPTDGCARATSSTLHIYASSPLYGPGTTK